MKRQMSILSLVVLALLAAGCTALPARQVVPELLVATAGVDGIPYARGWGDEMPSLDRLKTAELPALRAKYDQRARRGEPLAANMLALSGGGENGAFGAGLLVGWGERGDRPEFELVTGVSTGALIAPFAFLGKDYDGKLGELFVRYRASDILEANILGGVLGGSAVASNAPLAALIARYVDRDMLHKLAQERASGRLLLIGTTNLDAERPVYWDIGRIAQSGNPTALALIRSVILASAAIPGVFPPVRIEVVADGRKYQELHVDGGPTRQVFFSPNDFKFRDLDKAIGRKIKRNLYVIRNGKIEPEWQPATESVLAIGQRSLYTVTKNQALGDLIRMHSKATADGIGFHLAYIPATFRFPNPRPFDHAYMKALYDEGYRLGRAGYNWAAAPPGIGN